MAEEQGLARTRSHGWWRGRGRSVVVAVILIVGGLALVYGWSIASPIGSAPDDDFHQTSIWCPEPLAKSCPTQVGADGSIEVKVPTSVAASSCYAFHPDVSGECVDTLPNQDTWTSRVNNGIYPGGYYDVMHLFVGQNVERSIVVMRCVNGCLAIVLLALVAFCLPRSGRRLMAYSTLAVCVPLLIYIVCSDNPSSWAITGLVVAWFGAYAALKGVSLPKTITMVVATLIGAVMAAMARSDAGAYLMVAAVAISILFFRDLRKRLWLLVLPVLMMVIGVVGFLAGSQSDAIEGVQSNRAPGTLGTLGYNLENILRLLIDYTAGFMGLNWVDTVMPPLVWVPVATLSVAVAFIGLRSMDWRKLLVLIGLVGLYVSLPLVILQAGGYDVGSWVQPRYIAPLVPLILSVCLWRPKEQGSPSLSRAQTWLIYIGLVGAQSVALYTQIRRFVTGVDASWFNLDANVEWWWQAGPSPMATWLIGSLGFAILALALFFLRRDKDAEGNYLDSPVVVS